MFYVFPTPAAIAEYVSEQMVQRICHQNKVVLGLATGSTMKPVYDRLIDKLKQQAVNLDGVYCFNLDEYVGLAADHPQSYTTYMQEYLYDHLPFVPGQLFMPPGFRQPSTQECLDFSACIQQLGGIDLQLLGIGTNGHIGFNEPGTPFDDRTHVVRLSAQTRADNSRFFDDKSEMPTEAVTLGLQDIMDAKEILLIATGAHKAKIMAELQSCSVDERLPASILKTHPNTKILLDEAAAQYLDPEQCTKYSSLLKHHIYR